MDSQLEDIVVEKSPSFDLYISFDDDSEKHKFISIGDTVFVIYSVGGLRHEFTGVISNIKVNDSELIDPDSMTSKCKDWYIILKGVGKYEGQSVKFSPFAIIDLEIISKHHIDKPVFTSLSTEEDATPNVRVVENRFQYSTDGIHWENIMFDSDDIISSEDEE